MNNEYLTETKQTLEQIADLLYKGNINEGIAGMGLVIGNLAEISATMDEEMQGRMVNNALSPALEAMTNKDGVLLADIITYELLPIMDEVV